MKTSHKLALSSLLIFCTRCDPTPPPCTPPLYEDLSRWLIRNGSDGAVPAIDYDCGRAVGVRLDTPAGVAGLVRGGWAPPDRDDAAQVPALRARVSITSGGGRVLVELWHYAAGRFEGIASASLTESGAVDLIALRHLDEYRIDFVGLATAQPLAWSVERVELDVIQLSTDGDPPGSR
jgi:hypothetical protein